MSVEQTVFCKRINKMMSADAMTRCDDCIDGQEYVADLTKQLADKDERIELLEAVIKECDEYLKPNPKNSIGTGSILHQKLVASLKGESQ